jgi:hypothetical protein
LFVFASANLAVLPIVPALNNQVSLKKIMCRE